MTALLVGYDSAWTLRRRGGLVGALAFDDGSVRELSHPIAVDFSEAQRAIESWQVRHAPTTTVILLDQPMIVRNPTGQRPGERSLAEV